MGIILIIGMLVPPKIMNTYPAASDCAVIRRQQHKVYHKETLAHSNRRSWLHLEGQDGR